MLGSKGLYIQLISIHGLIRGNDLELGRDADTGGQTLYVVDLAKALSRHRRVERVDLLTRQVSGKNISSDYGQPVEQIAEKAFIVRIPCGPKRYLRKESLWPYLDNFLDHTLQYIRRMGRVPDVIHGHYADAGYVGSQVAHLLGVPFVFTGHSLGRVKKARLLAGRKGVAQPMEGRYNFPTRIEAEEIALNAASFVVVSTHQEIEEQYKMYDYYEPTRMEVISPGVNLGRFSPPDSGTRESAIAHEVGRFLRDQDKPMVLAIARPDERKNLPALVEAFAQHQKLRSLANLVLIAGNRQSFAQLPHPQRKVLRTIMTLIDFHDLYGCIACPKQHKSDDIPDLYRLATTTGGVFVNPAFTEPFGLTLIEASACGLPIIATNDGGPRDILRTCKNGQLIDPLDVKGIAKAIYGAISDKKRWERWSKNGVQRSSSYSWESHVERYIKKLTNTLKPANIAHVFEKSGGGSEWISKTDRLLVSSIDDIWTSNSEKTKIIFNQLRRAKKQALFGVATRRSSSKAVRKIEELSMPQPDILIASVGTEICYGKNYVQDISWQRHINYQWDHNKILVKMKKLRQIELQEKEISPFKIVYKITGPKALKPWQILAYLRKQGLRANVFTSRQVYIYIVPLRASIGRAIRYLSFKWNLPSERILAVGSTGCEQDMLSGNLLGVVVGNHGPELAKLKDHPRVFFAKRKALEGLIEGVEYYNFFKTIRVPGEGE